MRVYKHWLKIDWRSNRESEDIQYNKLNEFITKYPESKITVYNRTSGAFEKVFCLETDQSYDELDLDCNSLLKGSITRMERKPNNIEPCKISFKQVYSIHFRITAAV